jgi:glucokinase
MPASASDTFPITAVGVDFGGTFIKLGVCRGGELLESGEPIPTAAHSGPVAQVAIIAERVKAMRQRHPDIAAIGVGVPGLVDFDHGYVHVLTNVPGWNGVQLKEMLSAESGLPVTVENDANAMTYAEWRYGAGRGLKNVIGVTLGTGVGGGAVLDGKMYRGSQFSAGEIGQMSIHYAGVDGHYGNFGALEKYIGNQQIGEHAARRYAQTGLHREPEQCTPKALADAAQNGDEVAREVWNDVATWLGTAIASIAWLLNPDAFVIGGGVAQSGALLFEPLKKRVQSMLSAVVWDHLQILPAKFHNEAGIIGNAALAGDMVAGK